MRPCSAQPVEKLNVMALEFAPDGTLYAVGDANPASPTFNTLYTVDQKTGAFTAVGSTGVPAPEFFMDLAFDARGTMYGASMFGLFTIDRKTGTATKVVDFVGGGVVMGLVVQHKTIAGCMRPTGSRRSRRSIWSTLKMDF